MLCATADAAVSIQIVDTPQIDTPIWNRRTREASAKKQYARWFAAHSKEVLDSVPETSLYKLTPIEPVWLATTQQRIRKSVSADSSAAESDGRWLSQDVANAADDFFRETADLLPEEPYIYGMKGNLVAEFKAKHGTLTSVVSPNFVVLFAIVDGKPIEKTISETERLREEVEELTQLLRTGQHGTVEAHR